MLEIQRIENEEAVSTALSEIFVKIQDRIRRCYENPLNIKYPSSDCRMDWCLETHHPFYELSEVVTELRLGFIPQKKSRKILVVFVSFYGSAYGKKEVNAELYDKQLLPVVQDELQRYADTFGASRVNIKI